LAAPAAKFIASCNNVIYAACLDYIEGEWKRPRALACSTRNWPNQWPAVQDYPDDGEEWDGFAVTGEEITGLATWREMVVVFFDSETFLMAGDLAGARIPIFLAPVGCLSNRTIASDNLGIYWSARDGFYYFDGSGLANISRDAINEEDIDLTKPHDAWCDGERYICHCYYQGVPSLLIYDTERKAWVARRLVGMVGGLERALSVVSIVRDGARGQVFGLTEARKLVRLCSGDAFETDFGAGNPIFTIETAELGLGMPGRDTVVEELLVDLNPAAAASLTAVVTGRGRKQETTTKELPVTLGAVTYELPCGIPCRVAKVKISAAMLKSQCPEVHALAFTTPEEAPAR
ncbi:MAG: hypothetical protein KKA81_17340, partial [Bacteroidetes bacterium]|nr:hypothetical protein [Bacteroidota bacterium]